MYSDYAKHEFVIKTKSSELHIIRWYCSDCISIFILACWWVDKNKPSRMSLKMHKLFLSILQPNENLVIALYPDYTKLLLSNIRVQFGRAKKWNKTGELYPLIYRKYLTFISLIFWTNSVITRSNITSTCVETACSLDNDSFFPISRTSWISY